MRLAIRAIALGATIMAGRLGIGYLPAFEPVSLPAAIGLLSTENVPLVWWAGAWLGAAAAALVGVFRASLVWLSGVVGMSGLWAVIWTIAYFAPIGGEGSREWLTALQYVAWVLVLAGCVRAYALARRRALIMD